MGCWERLSNDVTGWGKVAAAVVASALSVSCTTVAIPWNRDVDRVEVGRIRNVEPIDIIIPGGGVDVTIAEGSLFTLEVDGRPGEFVKFLSHRRGCPTDPPGDTRYLVHLAWSDRKNGSRQLWMTACTPINPEASFGF